MIHWRGLLVASAALIVLYNVAVGWYAQYRMQQMANLPLEACRNDEAHSKSVAELRQTVSSRSGLVENLDHRRAWNTWLLSPPTESSCQNLKQDLVVPGTYTFMYRSYVNFEESVAIKKTLLHLPTLVGIVSTRRTVIIFDDDGKKVTLTDYFRKGLTAMSISWQGILTERGSRPTIVWTSSSMITGRGMAKTTIMNPPMSEKLRQIPWEIVKVEDGMIGFRRGDVGFLVYAITSDT